MNPTLKHWLGNAMVLFGPAASLYFVVFNRNTLSMDLILVVAGITAGIIGLFMVNWKNKAKDSAFAFILTVFLLEIGYVIYTHSGNNIFSVVFIALSLWMLHEGLEALRRSNS